METPTARVLEAGKFRVGASYVDPYIFYYGAVSPIKGLEIDGRITEILDTDTSSDPTWADYGNYKDKAFDIKYQFLPEGKYTPALAFGIMDPHGTRIYTGQYLVASKQIFPFDFTIGVGNGRFGKRPVDDDKEFGLEIFTDPKQWIKDAQVFGGVQFTPHPKISFMVEYNPIRYDKQTTDPAQAKHFKNYDDSFLNRLNYGIRIMPFDWTEIDLSYQRGEEFGRRSAAFETLARRGRRRRRADRGLPVPGRAAVTPRAAPLGRDAFAVRRSQHQRAAGRRRGIHAAHGGAPEVHRGVRVAELLPAVEYLR